MEQYEEPGYFHNIGDPEVSRLRADWLYHKYHPKTVLELGAGRFSMTQVLRALGANAWGIDWSLTACKFAPDCSIRSQVETLPFKDKSFDLITAFDVLEHIPKEQIHLCLKEIHRISNGTVIANIPFEDPANDDAMHHPTLRGRFFWEALFKQCFQVELMNDIPPTFIRGFKMLDRQINLFTLTPNPSVSELEVRL